MVEGRRRKEEGGRRREKRKKKKKEREEEKGEEGEERKKKNKEEGEKEGSENRNNMNIILNGRKEGGEGGGRSWSVIKNVKRIVSLSGGSEGVSVFVIKAKSVVMKHSKFSLEVSRREYGIDGNMVQVDSGMNELNDVDIIGVGGEENEEYECYESIITVMKGGSISVENSVWVDAGVFTSDAEGVLRNATPESVREEEGGVEEMRREWSGKGGRGS